MVWRRPAAGHLVFFDGSEAAGSSNLALGTPYNDFVSVPRPK